MVKNSPILMNTTQVTAMTGRMGPSKVAGDEWAQGANLRGRMGSDPNKICLEPLSVLTLWYSDGATEGPPSLTPTKLKSSLIISK
ncbi:hypothetical protein SFRURICE_016522 [Spodoptera frugiperda]|nr:hypothetical protein SFRURICE_016522 [Spodoptera frugiperda]